MSRVKSAAAVRRPLPFVPVAAAALAAFALPLSAFAQTPPVTTAAATPAAVDRAAQIAALEKAIEAERVKLGIPGLALAVVEGDKVLLVKGFGYRDAEKKLPVTPDTLFAIGSTTKAFTALAVLQAQDKGKLSLDAHPRTYLPYFKVNDPDTDAKITVRDLLCHRSGLTRTDLAMVSGKLNREELLRTIGEAKPAAKLGEKFLYQNLMFTAAGEAAARARRKDFDRLIEEDILKPLGMRASSLSAKRFLQANDRAQGYRPNFETKSAEPLPFRDIHEAAPAGAIVSSAADMARWLRFWLRGDGTLDGVRIAPASALAEQIKPQMPMGGKSAYGLGWFLHDARGVKVVEHGGNIDGFATSCGFLPDKKLGYVLLSNVSFSTLQGSMQNLFLRTMLPDAFAPAAAPSAAELASLPKVDPKDEAGSYLLKEANLIIDVLFQDGKLKFTPPGQPSVTLEGVAGRRYKLGAPAPDGFFVTFRPAKNDPTKTELYLEQPQGNYVLSRQAVQAAGDAAAAASVGAWKSPITAEELLAKMVEAAGGEANLRKHKTRRVTATLDWENQGVKGDAIETAAAPNKAASRVTMRAVGKQIGWSVSVCDGAAAAEWASFVPNPVRAEGKQLAKALLEADFTEGLIDAKNLFEKVEIIKQAKVNGEDCYVAVKTPKGGLPPITEYVSAKTFLVLRRDTFSGGGGGPTVPTTAFLSDYRPVDGVMVAFTRAQEDMAMGRVVQKITKVEWDVPVSPKTFEGPKKK